MKRILAIWLPNWSVQRLVSIRPELRGQAVILDRASRRGREVATCSPMARKLGVRPGMPIAEAAALVRLKKGDGGFCKASSGSSRKMSSDPFCLAHDPQADRLALEKLAAWCHQYSPHVGLEELKKGDGGNLPERPSVGARCFAQTTPVPFFMPETLLLDATGIAPLFGGERSFIDQVARGFQRLRFTAQLALADTVGAAWAVSHFGCQNPLAAETNIVPSGDSCAAVGQLPLAALRLPAAMVETLSRLGLQQIGELQLIPRVELQARFGMLLLKRLDQALGAAHEVIRYVQPPSDFTAQWLLEHPTDRHDAIQTVVQRLVEQLARRLADSGQGALQLTCQLDVNSDVNPTRQRAPGNNNPWGSRPRLSAAAASQLRGTTGVAGDERSESPANNGAGGSLRSTPATRSTTSFEIGLFRPSAEPRHLLELVNMQMEQAKLPGPVSCVSVQVLRHARLEHRQQGLFDRGERKSESRQVSVLVDRLAGRLGRESVVRCVLQSDAQPEFAYREEPLIDQKLQRSRAHSTRSFLSPLDRPLHLLKEPLAIQVMAIAHAGPPIRFRYRGHDCQVVRHWGPERIETGWWRRRGVQRDYYRVETKKGQRFWLFRQMQTGEWFLQGVFE